MQQLSGIENAIVGVLAGSIEVCIDQPMIYLKNSQQQSLNFTLNPRMLYRGLGTSICNTGTTTCVQFISTGYAKQIITGGINREMSIAENLLAGFMGGSVSGVFRTPVELTMIQQQRFGWCAWDAVSKIVSTCGVTGLTRGMFPTILREAIFAAGMLGMCPSMQTHLERVHDMSSSSARVTAAISTGICYAFVTHPIDTVTTCMQGDIEQKKFTNFFKTFRVIYSQRGLQRLYLGWGWRCTRLISAAFLINLIKDVSAPVLFPHRFITKQKIGTACFNQVLHY